MYISVETPRHSTRGHRDDDGQDLADLHRPEPSSTAMSTRSATSFAELERFAAEPFRRDAPTIAGPTRITRRWTMRRSSAGRRRCGDAYLVATGFNAWGITNGTAAAILIADLIEGRDNPWLEAVRRDPDQADRRRRRVRQGHCRGRRAPDRRLSRAQAARASTSWRRARRAILKVDGHNVAGFRDEEGALHAVLGGLHPYGLPGRLERDRPDLGLPLPRLALRARRRA